VVRVSSAGVPVVRALGKREPHPFDKDGKLKTIQCGWKWAWGSGMWITGYKADKMRAAGRDPHRCLKGSTYTVDGVAYCRTHAALVVLENLEELEKTR
jgi:hypothetical protein